MFQEGIQIFKLKNTINSKDSNLENEKFIRCNESERDNVYTDYNGRKFSWEELIYGLSDLNRHKHEIDQEMKNYQKAISIEEPAKKEKSLNNWKRKNRSLYRLEAYFGKDFMNIQMQDIDVEGLALAIDILNPSKSINFMLN